MTMRTAPAVLAIVTAAALGGCTVPNSAPPPPPEKAAYGGFNSSPLVTPQTPGASLQNAGPNQPEVPLNSLPPGAAGTTAPRY